MGFNSGFKGLNSTLCVWKKEEKEDEEEEEEEEETKNCTLR